MQWRSSGLSAALAVSRFPISYSSFLTISRPRFFHHNNVSAAKLDKAAPASHCRSPPHNQKQEETKKIRAQRNRTTHAKIPLPGRVERQDTRAYPSDIGLAGLAKGHAGASLQCRQSARGQHHQAMRAGRRRHDIRLPAPVDLRSQNREWSNELGQ